MHGAAVVPVDIKSIGPSRGTTAIRRSNHPLEELSQANLSAPRIQSERQSDLNDHQIKLRADGRLLAE